jgi:hypothetical protein
MHLLVFPFILAGLTTKIINSKMGRKLQPDNPEKQLDIIIASFFKNIKPTNFEGILDDNFGQEDTETELRKESENFS